MIDPERLTISDIKHMVEEPECFEPADPITELVWRGLQISIQTARGGGRGISEEAALEILRPLEEPQTGR